MVRYLTEITCTQCGRCCYKKVDGKLKKCKYLVILPTKKTLCRIYKTRLGTDIGDGHRCVNRTDVPDQYPDCPYNELVLLKFGVQDE